MTTSTRSFMDKNPDCESFYRNTSLLAITALAVHVLLTYHSPSDCDSLTGWLASAMPMILSGLILFGLFFIAADDTEPTRYFSLTTRTVYGGKRLRISSDPAREDRHLFYVQVIAFAVGLGISIDLMSGWYLLCQNFWDNCAKSEPYGLLFFVTALTVLLVLLLIMTWLPMWGLLQTKRDFGGQQYTDGSEERALLRTLLAAAEAYEKNLRSQMEPLHSKMQAIVDFLDVLQKWQTSGR